MHASIWRFAGDTDDLAAAHEQDRDVGAGRDRAARRPDPFAPPAVGQPEDAGERRHNRAVRGAAAAHQDADVARSAVEHVGERRVGTTALDELRRASTRTRSKSRSPVRCSSRRDSATTPRGTPA